MEYPVHGKLSFGAYYASDEEDLIKLGNYLVENFGWDVAKELADLYPEVLVRVVQVELTQKEVDLLHLLLGYVASSTALELDEKIISEVSGHLVEEYNRVSYNVNSEDGLVLKVDLEG